jgi:hypothetical protein
LSVLAGTCVLSWKSAAEAWRSPEKEARSLARWFSGLVTRSNRSGRSFEFFCPGNEARNVVEAMWLNPVEKETYTSLYGCKFLRYQSNRAESAYSPQWNTLVPTATIKVSRERAEYFVVISQRGRARTSPRPPE